MRAFQAGVLATLGILLGACSSDDAAPGGSSDATTDAKVESGIDCSKVGCAPPPPCGQTCKEVCGCCVDPSCVDAGGDGATKDAADAASDEARSDVGDAD